jgi:CubicO group peptidase (beta-lactamase class C family)
MMSYRFRKWTTFIAIIFISSIPVSAKSLPKVKPEKVGLSSDRLERVSRLFEGFVDKQQLAGAVALIARHGKVAYFKAWGRMDLDEGLPMRRDTIFRIASMTKPITSTAVLILHEEGRLFLNQPASRYIPEWNDNLQVYTGMRGGTAQYTVQEVPVSIRHLLTHTSGLTYGVFGDTPVDKAYVASGMMRLDLDGMVQKLTELPLLFQPGERWNYSVSTDVLGKLIENVSGMTLDEFFAKRIFQPLGMKDSGFFVTEDKIGRAATIYQPKDTGEGLQASLNPRKNPRTSQRPKMLSGGGGLYSTAMDYLLFCQMILNGGELHDERILSPKTVQLMTQNHVGDLYTQKGYGFGLGFAVHTDQGESGLIDSEGTLRWGGIFNTTFFIDPEEELIAIAMSQLRPHAHLNMGGRFKLLVYQSIIE